VGEFSSCMGWMILNLTEKLVSSLYETCMTPRIFLQVCP